MKPIKVIVRGAAGSVGREIIRSLPDAPDIQIVGAVDTFENQMPFGIPFSTDLEQVIKSTRPDVMVDFTLHDAVMEGVRVATRNKVNLVIGTTGITQTELEEIDRLAKENEVGAIVAPNFSLGAVVMMYLARIAGKYFDYAEIIEEHHENKQDAPSGTAMATARGMVEAKGGEFYHPSTKNETSSRGDVIGGISIHSIRMPGRVAHQEVILGGPGQTLSIRHDTTGRECYIPGIVLAIKDVINRKGLVFGLDSVLHLNPDNNH